MSSFIKTLRTKIANAIAPTQATLVIAPGTKNLSSGNTPKHLMNQAERVVEPRVYAGKVSASQLSNLHSEYLKDTLAQYGAWSALARAFSEYERVTNKRAKDDIKLGQLLDEFHAWNAVTSDSKQMGEEQVLDTIARLTVVSPTKGNDATDAIIARVRKVSVKELRQQREEEAVKATAKREALLEAFVAQVWSFTYGDLDPAISGTKAVTKALQTMEFVANSWQGNPANIAGELLLMEADLKILEKIAEKDEDADQDAKFIDGTLTTDGMMNQVEDAGRVGSERVDLTPKAREMVRRVRKA